MDLNYTREEQAFREEARSFVRDNLPKDIADKVLHHKRLVKDDWVRWQKILYNKGWVAPNSPKEYGGCAWATSSTTPSASPAPRSRATEAVGVKSNYHKGHR